MFEVNLVQAWKTALNLGEEKEFYSNKTVVELLGLNEVKIYL